MSEEAVPHPDDPTVVFTVPGTDVRVERYAVASATEDQPHGVTVINELVWSCSCLGFRYRWREPTFTCRHMRIIYEKLRNKRVEAEKAASQERTTRTTVDSVLASIAESRPPKMPFMASRYPFTYAADLLRNHPGVLPQVILEWAVAEWMSEPHGTLWSRQFASRVCERWAETTGCDVRALAEVLAYSYLTLNEIEMPADLPKPNGVDRVDAT